MRLIDAVVYDCEIVKAIAKRGEEMFADIEYCHGWRDYEGMGISVICCYDYMEQRYRVFCADNLQEFQNLVNQRRVIVSFNGLGFDNPLCAANGLTVDDGKSYDLLSQAWVAAGFGPKWSGSKSAGFGLDACAKANFGLTKVGHGAMAPVDWQRGKIGSVIDYCLHDVLLTKRLFDRVVDEGRIRDPRSPGSWLQMAKPPLGEMEDQSGGGSDSDGDNQA